MKTKPKKSALAKPVRAWIYRIGSTYLSDLVWSEEEEAEDVGLFNGRGGYVPVEIREVPGRQVRK